MSSVQHRPFMDPLRTAPSLVPFATDPSLVRLSLPLPPYARPGPRAVCASLMSSTRRRRRRRLTQLIAGALCIDGAALHSSYSSFCCQPSTLPLISRLLRTITLRP
ncbi:uncharacterized protein SCHCODRAFT_02102403 [Schizophyllum commune H4-8]|uniref:uncharacterized protein n=1 Tax=Schizophyllum commune (strain H4-8 / FGSC 9210) TaxID=578458 RepID=UPI00215F6107|nr:uncharacterized protein SCHCODRAFT_02102403 [Schizophyllum commune H4-8]KAI5886619.1 hypothetical protein SCHCODRAFT_02102403 [Schizophyllum commune H4-8]